MEQVEELKGKVAELEALVEKQKEALLDGARDYDTWKKRINPFIMQRLVVEILREYVANPVKLKELSEESGIYIIKDDPLGVTVRFTKKEITCEEKILDMSGDCPLAGVRKQIISEMEKKKIYIVTSGCYSDYRIERVFSTKEKAEEFLDLKDDNYDLAVFPLDDDLPPRKTKLWRVVLGLNTKDVLTCNICFDKTMKDLVQFSKDSYDKKNSIEFYIETCSRRRAKKIASERYGAVIANEQLMYPYLRQRVLEESYGSDGYPYYDFNTGEIVLMDGDEFDDSILTYDAETYDESKLAEYLPKGMRFRRAKKEEGKK